MLEGYTRGDLGFSLWRISASIACRDELRQAKCIAYQSSSWLWSILRLVLPTISNFLCD